jgi:hypothetical protein
MCRTTPLLLVHDVDRGNFGLYEGRRDPNSCGRSMQGPGSRKIQCCFTGHRITEGSVPLL